jgi:CheY-like chemotaxis protein
VTIECSLNNPDRMQIAVSDTGVGLPPEKLRQLFQPFNRLGQESSGEEGTGIGLVMCKRVVELMGGMIGVESKVGEGSTFWFELNSATAPQSSQDSTEPEAVVLARVPEGAPRHTLLYVEDNPANLTLVERLIARRSDIRLICAVTGDLGVAAAREQQPQVILMDINLPGSNGFEALRILRDDPATAHIPVIALSANAMLRTVEKGKQAGFFAYLTKPINVVEFMEVLDRALALATEQSTADRQVAAIP